MPIYRFSIANEKELKEVEGVFSVEQGRITGNDSLGTQYNGTYVAADGFADFTCEVVVPGVSTGGKTKPTQTQKATCRAKFPLARGETVWNMGKSEVIIQIK
jgi:hypothetical protein